MNNILKAGAGAALCCVAFCIYAFLNGYSSGPRRADLENLYYVALITSTVCFFCFAYILLDKKYKDDNHKLNIISLWLKRKRLEEEKRIKDLNG